LLITVELYYLSENLSEQNEFNYRRFFRPTTRKGVIEDLGFIETLRTEKHQTINLWISSKQLRLLNGLSKGQAKVGVVNKLGEDSIWEVSAPAPNGACVIKFNLNFFNKHKEDFNKSLTETERRAKHDREFEEQYGVKIS